MPEQSKRMEDIVVIIRTADGREIPVDEGAQGAASEILKAAKRELPLVRFSVPGSPDKAIWINPDQICSIG